MPPLRAGPRTGTFPAPEARSRAPSSSVTPEARLGSALRVKFASCVRWAVTRLRAPAAPCRSSCRRGAPRLRGETRRLRCVWRAARHPYLFCLCPFLFYFNSFVEVRKLPRKVTAISVEDGDGDGAGVQRAGGALPDCHWRHEGKAGRRLSHLLCDCQPHPAAQKRRFSGGPAGGVTSLIC